RAVGGARPVGEPAAGAAGAGAGLVVAVGTLRLRADPAAGRYLQRAGSRRRRWVAWAAAAVAPRARPVARPSVPGAARAGRFALFCRALQLHAGQPGRGDGPLLLSGAARAGPAALLRAEPLAGPAAATGAWPACPGAGGQRRHARPRPGRPYRLSGARLRAPAGL